METIIDETAQEQVILIVDDNPQNLQVLGKQLIEKKYKVEFAVNGLAALEWLDKNRFDLILLDINMPGMSGFEVCTQVRSTHRLDNVPIIFLSADIDRESILKGFELGAQDYITKPFDSRELLVRVKTHLALKDSRERLEILNRSLEQKVDERTYELKLANEKLEVLNLKLIDLDKAKSDFLSLISHEIRTPLNGIIGPLEMLKGPLYASEIGDMINILDISVKRLERFAIDALLITRLKTKPNEIYKEQISISSIINEIILENADKVRLKKIKIEKIFDFKHDIIYGEKELVKKAIFNVFDNAIYFSPFNSIIEVSTFDSANNSVLRIRDNGCGFEEVGSKYLSKLFAYADMFRDNSKGIGLPMVKLIMESHGGEVKINNDADGGADVRLFFPIEPKNK